MVKAYFTISVVVFLAVAGYVYTQPKPIEATPEHLCSLRDVVCANEPKLTEINAIVYAYTSRPEETDSTPFTTAFGTKVRDGIIANNCLRKGTVVLVYGKSFVVEDKMNSRYGCEVFDIWMDDLGAARQWGKRELTVAIYD